MMTASATASIRIRTQDYTFVQNWAVDDFEKYVRLLAEPTRHLSDYKPENLIYIPNPIKPQWLATIKARLLGSIAPKHGSEVSSGEWLSQEVADAAISFFQKTSDLLPGEPFIYSSQLGDLVAEFSAENGTMTVIVSPAFALLSAVINGLPLESKVIGNSDARHEVQLLTEKMLHTGQHGAVDTAA